MAIVGIDTNRLDDVKAAVSAVLAADDGSFLTVSAGRAFFAASVHNDVGTAVGRLVGTF